MFWHSRSSSYDAWVKALKRFPNLDGHIFLGVSAWTGEPILIPYSLLFEHTWVTGGSSSGKTAMILGPMMSQIIASGKFSVIYTDQKYDQASFWNLFAEAHKARIPFKYF